MTASPQSQDRVARYLSLVLELSPIGYADEIVQTRARFLANEEFDDAAVQSASAAGTSPEDETESRAMRRAEADAAIDEIRSNFWNTPLEPLQRSLQNVECAEFPELEDIIERLEVVARDRHLFAELTDQRGFDPQFFKGFRKLVTAPASDAVGIREKLYTLARQWRRNRDFKKMIRLLRRKIPQTCRLEDSFLESVMQLKPGTVRTAPSRTPEVSYDDDDGWGCGSVMTWIAVSIFLRMIVRLLGE